MRKLLQNDLLKISFIYGLFFFASCTSDGQFGCPKRNNPDERYHSISFTFDSVSSFYKRLDLDPQTDTLPIAKLSNSFYYLQGSTKVYDTFVALTRWDRQYYISTSDALYASAFANQKQFFMEWPNGSTDTLLIDFKHEGTADNACCCSFPLQAFTLNGESYTHTQGEEGIYFFAK